jgi:hypothetical protein
MEESFNNHGKKEGYPLKKAIIDSTRSKRRPSKACSASVPSEISLKEKHSGAVSIRIVN